MPVSIGFSLKALHLPLKTVFKQASFERRKGESIWCETNRNNIQGLGEGCPRFYVTKETVSDALEWLQEQLPSIETNCQDPDQLITWIAEHRSEIDLHPAAFCSIDTALLDLFAREQQLSVEQLLGINGPGGTYRYTGVLGDSNKEKYRALCQRYAAAGISDFKVKVNGDLAKDREKLKVLRTISMEQGCSSPRIRMDANNLWEGKPESAISYLTNLDVPIFGIEEPVAPKRFSDLSQISMALGIPVILDESLCNLTDLEAIDKLGGTFIANIKVSRLGGVLRSLEMVRALQQRGHQIILGAHVGETSVLTRAAMCVARATGASLVAQEGAYGLMLLEQEPVEPSLMFGKKGQINLSEAYTQINWGLGWGLKKKRNKS